MYKSFTHNSNINPADTRSDITCSSN